MNAQDFFANLSPTPTQYLTTINNKQLWIKRDDLNDTEIQGNKLRKLKATLLTVQKHQLTLLSFGGAYSNHIAALAAAGNRFNLKTIGIIRGQELGNPHKQSNTLKTASDNGMQLHFISRDDYRQKAQSALVKHLQQQHDSLTLIPEGGSNSDALKGTSEIIDEIIADNLTPIPDQLFCACGTGGTLAGILQGIQKHRLNTRCIGVAVLKGADFLYTDIRRLNPNADQVDWALKLDAHGGGYAKTTPALLTFIEHFEQAFNLPLDPIYTGKLCQAVIELAKQSDGKPENWLIYHSGGLQGR